MEAFAELFEHIDQTTSTNEKVRIMTTFFRRHDADTNAWVLFFLSGQKMRPDFVCRTAWSCARHHCRKAFSQSLGRRSPNSAGPCRGPGRLTILRPDGRTGSPLTPSQYCSSIPRGLPPPRASFATNRHE